MGIVLSGLGAVCGLVAFVCYIIVVVKIFQNGQTGLGIAAILTLCCLGIGHIIALVVGWQNADRWAIRQLMLVYSISLGVGILLSGIGQAMGGTLILIQQQ
jgi:hypothetical protein